MGWNELFKGGEGEGSITHGFRKSITTPAPRRAAAAVAHRFSDRARDEHQYAARRAVCTAETRQRSTLADPFRTHYCAPSGRARDGAPIATGLNIGPRDSNQYDHRHT